MMAMLPAGEDLRMKRSFTRPGLSFFLAVGVLAPLLSFSSTVLWRVVKCMGDVSVLSREKKTTVNGVTC